MCQSTDLNEKFKILSGTLEPSVEGDIIQKNKELWFLIPPPIPSCCLALRSQLVNLSFSFIGISVHAIILASNLIDDKSYI